MPGSTSRARKRGRDFVHVYFNRQDPGLLYEDEGDAIPLWDADTIEDEGPYQDGPITPRVAVLDVDPLKGVLRPGARFQHRPRGSRLADYAIPLVFDPDYGYERPDMTSDAYLQVSVFTTVTKAIHWFEKPELFGRRLQWAFDAPQLLVIPRAGEMANAFYDRDTHSLQFFILPSPSEPNRIIHTALSRDIVVHETAHAILDGVAPDLLGAITPQARALHEAIADLAALLTSLQDDRQLFYELEHWGRSIRGRTAFSRLAEELGGAVLRDIGADALRDANNDSTLDQDDDTVDSLGRRNYIDDMTDIHTLSSVLTGAIYRGFLRATDDRPETRAVKAAAGRIARMVFRALDYLPPGELSFADFGRAVLVADRVVQPQGRKDRDWLMEELVRRKIVDRPDELDIEFGMDAPVLKGLDLRVFEQDPAAIRPFVSANRGLFGVPSRGRFTVHQPLRVRRRSVGSKASGAADTGDLVIKVSWPVVEDNDLGPRFPRRRTLVLGSTTVLDPASRSIRFRLHGGGGDPSTGREERNAFLARLAEEGLLRPPDEAVGPDGVRLRVPMVARLVGGAMVPTGGARMLHWSGGPRCLT